MRDPELARAALDGLRRYQDATLSQPRPERPVVQSFDGAALRDCGGSGPLLVLVPSLINPPTILDLDPDCSLAEVLARRYRVLLLDWGPAAERRGLDLDGHVAQRLVPLLERARPVVLVGYCLGGLLALAAATALNGQVKAVATLASPYKFDAYPAEARSQLMRLWQASRASAEQLGFLPMEVLQSAFWQVDPERLIAKFARFASYDSSSRDSQRFVALEDWANGGEPLPLPAARHLVERLFEGGETFSPLPSCPMLHVTAAADRIVPAATAAPGEHLSSPSGHVGMMVGRDAAQTLHEPLLSWLDGTALGG